ncbi:hypothetical protein TNCV_3462111 [Trichonephila clavipes]|nr:hypothetical protein TNCV_3462111 [Trichonephila clavipes]
MAAKRGFIQDPEYDEVPASLQEKRIRLIEDNGLIAKRMIVGAPPYLFCEVMVKNTLGVSGTISKKAFGSLLGEPPPLAPNRKKRQAKTKWRQANPTTVTSIFDAKDAPRTGRPVVENVNKITEIIEIDRHVSSRSIAQELKIDHKTV